MASLKQKIEHYLTITHAQATQLLRQGKHDVIIRRGEQLIHPILYPLLPLHATTIHTVSIATAMVLVVCVVAAAIIASVLMEAYARCVA